MHHPPVNSALYIGQVYHKRTRPKVHKLHYRVFSLLLDLSEIDHLADSLWLFSRNRLNLLSFHDKDFGEQPGESLQAYVERHLKASGVHTMPARIQLSCYPRVLGYAFNPLSMYYCLDESDHCYAVLHEVHNTFGERHAYLLPVGADDESVSSAATESAVVPVSTGNDSDTHGAHNSPVSVDPAKAGDHPVKEQWFQQKADKALFVSPFAHMGMHYRFRLNRPGKRQVVVIRAYDAEGLVITASYVAQRVPLTVSGLLKCLLRLPPLGLKVIGGIHLEALVLWVRGVPLFRHQPKQSA